jgi:hypothetical protein
MGETVNAWESEEVSVNKERQSRHSELFMYGFLGSAIHPRPDINRTSAEN